MSDRDYTDARFFDRRATFQRPVNSRSTSGDMEIVWITVCTAWVGVKRQNLSERLKEPIVADELHSIRDYIMKVRAETVVNNSITEDCRVLMDDVYYDIKAIADNVLAARTIDIQIRAGINDG